tara:strand:+ start:581 stop:805 length:225 start_codon:yes stop_codon:yes gene_type:complete
MTKLFNLVHIHKYGNSTYSFTCNREVHGYYNEECGLTENAERIVKALDISYEPELGESIEITEANSGEVQHIEL